MMREWLPIEKHYARSDVCNRPWAVKFVWLAHDKEQYQGLDAEGRELDKDEEEDEEEDEDEDEDEDEARDATTGSAQNRAPSASNTSATPTERTPLSQESAAADSASDDEGEKENGEGLEEALAGLGAAAQPQNLASSTSTASIVPVTRGRQIRAIIQDSDDEADSPQVAVETKAMDSAPPRSDSSILLDESDRRPSGKLTGMPKRRREEPAVVVVRVVRKLSQRGYGVRSGTVCLLDTCFMKIGLAKILCNGCNRSFFIFHEGSHLDAHLSACKGRFTTGLDSGPESVL
ncbi:hypothetical protein B484DRAFT_464248 [Ochromonadaceae sp. CCMP2298]|nr:hypothetical protein B484DRAFT_464248 [Ochromonadaceae sp. CCMP2298]